ELNARAVLAGGQGVRLRAGVPAAVAVALIGRDVGLAAWNIGVAVRGALRTAAGLARERDLGDDELGQADVNIHQDLGRGEWPRGCLPAVDHVHIEKLPWAALRRQRLGDDDPLGRVAWVLLIAV